MADEEQPEQDGGISRIAELEQQLKRAAEIGRNLLLQNEQLKNEKNELASQLINLQEEHRALEGRYEKTKETYTETENQNTELEKHVDLLQGQVAEQRAELGKLEALREEHKVLRIEYEACKLKLNQAEESFRKSLIEKKREAKIATSELVENASGLQRDVQDRDREIGQLRTRLQNMEALESQNQQLLAANETIPKLEADKEKLSSAVKNIVKVNRRLQTQLDEYQRLYAQAQGVIASLQEARPDGELADEGALDHSLADELELAMGESPINRRASPHPSQEEPSFEVTAQLLFEADRQAASSAASSSSSSDKDSEAALLEQVMEWRGLLNDSRSTLTSPMMNKHLTLPDLLHASTELLKVVQEEVKERLALEGEKKLIGQSREIVCQVLELLLQNSELRLEGNRFKLKTFNRVHEKPVPSAGADEAPPARPTQAQPSFLSFLGFNR